VDPPPPQPSVFIFSRRIGVHGNAYRTLHLLNRIVLYYEDNVSFEEVEEQKDRINL